MNFTSLTTAIALDTFLDSHPLFKHFCLLKIDTTSPYLKTAYEESLKWWKEFHKYE